MTLLRWQRRRYYRQERVAGGPRWVTYVGLVIFFVLLFSALTLMVIEWRLGPVINSWAGTRAINIATRAINLAIEETMASSISSTEMALLIQDNNGNMQGVQYDMGEINRVASQATHKIQQTLNNLGDEQFPIPLGQVMGLDFLAAWGPGIPVRIIPVGAVTTTPVGSFESAGINQTWHRVFLDIEVAMRVVVPLIQQEFTVQSRVPIVEEVFMGQVPTWYFSTNTPGVPSEQGLISQPGLLEFPLAP